jgi:phytanoyl-CoA hydroxylase
MGWLRDDGRYEIDETERSAFAEQGFVRLAGVLTEAEVAQVELVYDRFLRREIEVPGKDYCDMAGDYGRQPDDFSIVNVMLPRRYHPEWQGNVYERRTGDIARQLLGDRHVDRLRPAAGQAALQGGRRVRVAPGHGVLA